MHAYLYFEKEKYYKSIFIIDKNLNDDKVNENFISILDSMINDKEIDIKDNYNFYYRFDEAKKYNYYRVSIIYSANKYKYYIKFTEKIKNVIKEKLGRRLLNMDMEERFLFATKETENIKESINNIEKILDGMIEGNQVELIEKLRKYNNELKKELDF